jgi:hypothetical protein
LLISQGALAKLFPINCLLIKTAKGKLDRDPDVETIKCFLPEITFSMGASNN